MILPQDLTNPNVDELSVMTYVSFFRDAKRKGAAEKVREPAPRDHFSMPCRSRRHRLRLLRCR